MNKTIKTTIIAATLLTSIVFTACNTANVENTPKNTKETVVSTETTKNLNHTTTRFVGPTGIEISFVGHSNGGPNFTGHSNGNETAKNDKTNTTKTTDEEFLYKNTHPQVWHVNGVPYLGNDPLFE